MATHHPSSTRTAYGVPRRLHPTSQHPHLRTIREHDVGEHLAPTDSHLDAIPYPLHPPKALLFTGVQYTNIQKMTALWNQSPVPWGPPPQAPAHHYMPQMDWTRHLHWAKQHHQHSQHPAPLDPTLHWAIHQQVQIPNINEVRQHISEELQQLVSGWSDTTAEWFQQLPQHCQKAYRQPTMITQIPLLHYLLQTIQYPHADILFRELTDGFPLNWKVRTDTKYRTPITLRTPFL